MRSSIFVSLLLAAVACGGGSAAGPDKPTPEPKDPYAVLYIENTMTPRPNFSFTHYSLEAVFEPNETRPTGSASFLGDVSPGETRCTSLAGYPVLQRMALVGVADTSGITPPRPDAELQAASEPGAVLFVGAVLRTTGTFDPLVSLVDTTLGATPQRPVKWRWTITDSSAVLREDTTVPCKHLFDDSL